MERSREYRKLGWNSLRLNYWILLVIVIIFSVLSSFASTVPFLPLILLGVFSVALQKCFIKNSNKQEVEIEDYFRGMFDNAGDKIVLGLMVTIFQILWTLLFIIPGVIKGYAYAMSYYIQYRCNLPARDSIDLSQKMMSGKKWKLFCLHFSFIGWLILAAFTFGIGIIFLAPYFYAAQTEFFKDAFEEYNRENPSSVGSITE